MSARPGPPEQGGGANVVLVAIAAVFGGMMLVSLGVIFFPELWAPREVSYEEAVEPLAVPEALTREVTLDARVRYVWRDPERGRQVGARLSEVPEWARRWAGMVHADWESGDGLYFADLRGKAEGDVVRARWRATSELHAVTHAHDAGGSHAEDIAMYAVELLNVNDKSDRSARAKELKKYFDAEIEPRLVPERTARFMLGEPTPVKVVEPKR